MTGDSHATVTLKEFFVEKLTALEKSTELSRAALEKNVETARSALEKNTETARSALEKNTELARSSLEKHTEVSRLALEKQIEKLEADIRVLRESKATGEGSSNRTASLIATGLAVLGVAVSLFVLISKRGQ